jgi:hypothetical protein
MSPTDACQGANLPACDGNSTKPCARFFRMNLETPVFRRKCRYISIVSCRTWAEAEADSAQPG